MKPGNGSYHCLPSRVNEHCARDKEQDSLRHCEDDYQGEVDLCGGHQHYQECVFQGNKSLLVLSSTRSEIESGTWHHSFLLQIAFIYSKQISSVQFTLFGIWALKLIRLMHRINW